MDACTCVVVGVVAIIIILAFVFFILKPCNSMDQFYGGGGGATIPEGYDDPRLGDITREEIIKRKRRYERNLERQAKNEKTGDILDKYKMNAFSMVLVYNPHTFEAVKTVLGLDDRSRSYVTNGETAYYKWTELDSILNNAYGQTPSNRIDEFLQNVDNFMEKMAQETNNAFLKPTTSYGQIIFYMHALYETLSKNDAFPAMENYTMIGWINEKKLLPFDIADTSDILASFRDISMSMEHIWKSFVVPFNSDMYDVKFDTARIMFKNINKPVQAIQRLFIDPLAKGYPRSIDGFEADMAWLFDQVTKTTDLAGLQ